VNALLEDDLGAALGLVVEVLAWVEATPESELDTRTAVRWEESIAAGLQDMSPMARGRLLRLCEEWKGDGSYVPDEVLVALENSIDFERP